MYAAQVTLTDRPGERSVCSHDVDGTLVIGAPVPAARAPPGVGASFNCQYLGGLEPVW